MGSSVSCRVRFRRARAPPSSGQAILAGRDCACCWACRRMGRRRRSSGKKRLDPQIIAVGNADGSEGDGQAEASIRRNTTVEMEAFPLRLVVEAQGQGFTSRIVVEEQPIR